MSSNNNGTKCKTRSSIAAAKAQDKEALLKVQLEVSLVQNGHLWDKVEQMYKKNFRTLLVLFCVVSCCFDVTRHQNKNVCYRIWLIGVYNGKVFMQRPNFWWLPAWICKVDWHDEMVVNKFWWWPPVHLANPFNSISIPPTAILFVCGVLLLTKCSLPLFFADDR